VQLLTSKITPTKTKALLSFFKGTREGEQVSQVRLFQLRGMAIVLVLTFAL
jgi:hypothetical protein